MPTFFFSIDMFLFLSRIFFSSNFSFGRVGDVRSDRRVGLEDIFEKDILFSCIDHLHVLALFSFGPTFPSRYRATTRSRIPRDIIYYLCYEYYMHDTWTVPEAMARFATALIFCRLDRGTIYCLLLLDRASSIPVGLSSARCGKRERFVYN